MCACSQRSVILVTTNVCDGQVLINALKKHVPGTHAVNPDCAYTDVFTDTGGFTYQ
jgi:hypothetical protein